MSIEMADVSNLSLQTPTETRQGSVEEERMREKARSAQEQVSCCRRPWLTYLISLFKPKRTFITPPNRHVLPRSMLLRHRRLWIRRLTRQRRVPRRQRTSQDDKVARLSARLPAATLWVTSTSRGRAFHGAGLS